MIRITATGSLGCGACLSADCRSTDRLQVLHCGIALAAQGGNSQLMGGEGGGFCHSENQASA
jgi:hypothetical protein